MLLAVLGRLVNESGSWAVTPIMTEPVQRLFNFLIHTYCLEGGTVNVEKKTSAQSAKALAGNLANYITCLQSHL